MAGAKKKKKPAANPARGFATTSIASKPRPEIIEPESKSSTTTAKGQAGAPPSSQNNAPPSTTSGDARNPTSKEKELSAEEFEEQLKESELQLLVEKYAQKTKRDAQRQRARLETDRRLLRGQADSLNTSKWLPPDLMDHVLNLIQAETRFAASSITSDSSSAGKMAPEEDMVNRLWTLQQTLSSAEFPSERVDAVIRYILDIAPNVSSTNRDSIWGLEEALDWLARECPLDVLPVYDPKPKPVPKSTTDTPQESPVPTRSNTPRHFESRNGRKNKAGGNQQAKPPPKKKLVVTYDSDIEPDELLPQYLETKAKLLELERGGNGSSSPDAADELTIAKLEAKIRKIESDVLFDKFEADQKWKAERIIIERHIAAAKIEEKGKVDDSRLPEKSTFEKTTGEGVSDEAERIAAEILAKANGSGDDDDDDNDSIGGLFASLPQSEVDAATGETRTVLNSTDGTKVLIKDFGKWTGFSPRRALEEACRSRDASAKVLFTVVSETSFANRHSVDIFWSKPQELPQPTSVADIEIITDPIHFTFTMNGVATPDSKQSEAYAATAALYYTFSGNAKEEKVGLKLPPVWRDLWSELAEARKNQLYAQDRVVVNDLRELVRARHDQELEDGVIIQGAFRGRGAARNMNDSGDDGSQDRSRHNVGNAEYYQKIWAQKASSPKYQKMLQSRMQLPMWHFREQVLRAVDDNQVVIVCGETGCGKSTQVPSFLLEHQLAQGKPCKVYCTEPRRISAISLARRVSEELGENRNDLGTSRSLVGYSIRLEANTSRETRLVYATTGIVMRMLEASNDLQEVTHLVLDEVHERSIDSDFLLIVLKDLMKRRRDLKVILMSATVDAERFSAYLGGAPVLNVPGRTFPVQVRYLEDAIERTGYTIGDAQDEKMIDLDDDLVEGETDGPKSDLSKSLVGYSTKTRATLAQIDENRVGPDLIVQLIARIAVDDDLEAYSKAILVFLPGIAEIRTLNDLLLGDPRFAKDWLVYPLHSTIATEDQESAFLIPPLGMRKIVLATNIAETGITIPDVTCVIDTGKHREMRFDERRQLSRLLDTFVSRANAKQRRGRAGRVQEGLCFHMFTKYRHDNLMNDQQTPEMLRLSLQDLAIRVKICKIGGIEETLGSALDPPSTKNIRRAIDALVDVRALTAAEELTPLGYQLARLPLDVFLGKLILLGVVFKCLDMAITVAAILSSKSPFNAPFGQKAQADNARMAFRRADSDLLTVYNAYLAWKRVCQSAGGGGKEFQFCRKNFLNQQTLSNIEDLKGQLLTSLADSGFLSLTEEERRTLSRLRFSGGRGRRQQQFFEMPSRVNLNSDNDVISASVIAWSFYPKILVRDLPGSKGLRNIGNNQSISLHPSSVNRNTRDIKWLSYYHIMQAKSVYHAHEATATDPFAIALLCGDVRCDMYSGVIVLDGNRGRFAVPDWKTMLVIKVLRTRLRELLTRAFKQPGKLPTAQQEKWMDVWQRLFTQDFGEDRQTVGLTISKALNG